jgi:hypothetical protein
MRKLVLAGMLAGLFAVQAAQALTLEMTPSTQTKDVGQALSYDVWVKSVGTEIVSAYDIDIAYNTGILSLNSVLFGTGLNLGNLADSIQFSSGTVHVDEVTLLADAALLAGQADDFVLFTLAFTGIGAGTTNLQMTVNSMAGHSELDQFGDLIPVDLIPDSVTGASATIQSGIQQPPGVPEPSILALLGLGVLGMMSTRRARA